MNTKDSLLKKFVFIEVNILFKLIFSFDTDVPIMIHVILFTEKEKIGSKKLMKNISFKRLSKLNSGLLLATFTNSFIFSYHFPNYCSDRLLNTKLKNM